MSFGGPQWTFANLHGSIAAAAVVLANAQAKNVGRIGILSANRPGVVFAVHATTCISVPVVPLNWRQTEDEVAWQLRDAGITVLIVDEDRAAVAEAASTELPVAIVPITELERLPAPESARGKSPRIALELEAAVIYTSGTSGRPKGACQMQERIRA